MNKSSIIPQTDELPPAMAWQSFLLMLVASAAGAVAAIFILPTWLPGLGASMAGSTPQMFWFLSWASAMVAYLLLWLSMLFGLVITNKMARVWPGGPVAFDLHQHTSLLGIAFALFHGLILLGDHYLKITFWQDVIPFGMQAYRPLWVGLGQIAFYSFVIVGLSFYIRKQITPRTWRLLHYLSFITYLLALAHGLTSGSDSPTAWAQVLYWGTGGVFIFLFIYRVLTSVFKPRPAWQPA